MYSTVWQIIFCGVFDRSEISVKFYSFLYPYAKKLINKMFWGDLVHNRVFFKSYNANCREIAYSF